MADTWRRWNLLLAMSLLATMALAGCPRNNGSGTNNSGSNSSGGGDSTVSFDVVEKGSGNPLQAYVWVDGHQEDFETVMSGGDSQARFKGFGKTGDGYTVTFSAKQSLTFMAWAPDHEMTAIDTKLKRGDNLIYVELRKTEVDDDRVPEQIRLDVLERLPTEAPKTGS